MSTTPWQVADAQQRFGELLRAATTCPQFVTRNGKEIVVVVSIEEYRRLTGSTLEFTEFLRDGPFVDDLEIESNPELTRTVDLAPDV